MLKANHHPPPRVCAHNPQVVTFPFFPPPALGFCSWQSHNFKVKTEERCDTYTHTCVRRLHILQDLSVPVFPHFLPCHPVGLFRPLWCIIEAVCNFTDSFPVESHSELNFHFSHRSGIFSLKWKDQLFEHTLTTTHTPTPPWPVSVTHRSNFIAEKKNIVSLRSSSDGVKVRLSKSLLNVVWISQTFWNLCHPVWSGWCYFIFLIIDIKILNT